MLGDTIIGILDAITLKMFNLPLNRYKIPQSHAYCKHAIANFPALLSIDANEFEPLY